MPSKLCPINAQKVGIGDDNNLFNSADNNVFITIKDSRKVHLFHLNKSAVDTTNLPISPPACVDQPYPSISTDSDEPSKFSDLLSMQTFIKQTNDNGFHIKESSDYSLIYRNEIKLDEKFRKASVNGDLPLLFFIHGVGGNAKIWTNQMEFFYARGYEMIAIDLLGHGQTSCSKEKTNYEFLEVEII